MLVSKEWSSGEANRFNTNLHSSQRTRKFINGIHNFDAKSGRRTGSCVRHPKLSGDIPIGIQFFAKCGTSWTVNKWTIFKFCTNNGFVKNNLWRWMVIPIPTAQRTEEDIPFKRKWKNKRKLRTSKKSHWVFTI